MEQVATRGVAAELDATDFLADSVAAGPAKLTAQAAASDSQYAALNEHMQNPLTDGYEIQSLGADLG